MKKIKGIKLRSSNRTAIVKDWDILITKRDQLSYMDAEPGLIPSRIGEIYTGRDLTHFMPEAAMLEKNKIKVLELDYGQGIWCFNLPDWDEYLPDVKYSNDSAITRQFNRLHQYCTSISIGTLKQRVRSTSCIYFDQRDNLRKPHSTCNSSSNAMYLSWLQTICGEESLKNDNGYIEKVFKGRDHIDNPSIWHHIQTETIESYRIGGHSIKTAWREDHDLPFVLDLLKAGFPVVANFRHKGTGTGYGGHVVTLIYFDEEREQLIINDPYGSFSSRYARGSNGRKSIISLEEWERRNQGGYRILEAV